MLEAWPSLGNHKMKMCIFNVIRHWLIEIIVLETNSAKYVKFQCRALCVVCHPWGPLCARLIPTYSRNNPPHSPLLVYIIRTFCTGSCWMLSAGGMQWWYCQYCQTTWWSSETRNTEDRAGALPGSRAYRENTEMMRCESTCFRGSLTSFFLKVFWKENIFYDFNIGKCRNRSLPNKLWPSAKIIQARFYFGEVSVVLPQNSIKGKISI